MDATEAVPQESDQIANASTDVDVGKTIAENGSGVNEESVKSDTKTSSDKELSWEKIAAEFTEEQEFEETPQQTDFTEAPGDSSLEQAKEEAADAAQDDSTELFNDDAANFATPVNESVEITEVQVDQTIEETSEISYSVVEVNEAETHEDIEEHVAQMKETEETILVINTSEGTTEITIDELHEGADENVYLVGGSEHEFIVDEPEELPSTSQEPQVVEKPKKPRGRRPISDIPLHVLGRDITNPTEVSNGGRSMPKPRLGVKVPYKNLTSQIVSKAEIEQEILDRAKAKQEQLPQSAKDVSFARKLTQRLAKKIAEKDKVGGEKKTPAKAKATSSEIKNNSDLIAILEGEDEVVANKSPAPDTEREIALKQLEELPNLSSASTTTKVETKKFFKSRNAQKTVEKTTTTTTTTKASVAVAEKEEKPEASSAKVEAKIESKATTSGAEVEPRLKTGVVVKTYTRKRKSVDDDEDFDEEDDDDDDPTFLSPEKSPTPVLPSKNEEPAQKRGAYVTKSSRVIKRKVIWDPDEAPPLKSPLKPAQNAKNAEKKTPATPAKKAMVAPKNEPKATAASTSAKSEPPAPAKPVPSSPVKKQKRLTEIDRLLMDEGAVNMLYDVKNTEDSVEKSAKKKKTKGVISLDRAHRELMNKADLIKSDLQQNTQNQTQKSLRKKETAVAVSPKKDVKEATPLPISRKKSKDSTRSSVHSPPASPGFGVGEASRIIRRHSSSSFSSTDAAQEEGAVTRKKSAEPAKKKQRKEKAAVAAKETVKNNNNVEEQQEDGGKFSTFSARLLDNLATITLNQAHLTESVLRELITCLKEFGESDDCSVVVVNSVKAELFSKGLDYTVLVDEDETVLRKKATELASAVKDFMKCLLNFPKILVAAIQGECQGVAVTMLPLFDMVIASDTSTFSTPYSKLGSVAEAGFLLAAPHLNNHGLASELLYTSQVIKADDAFRKGLVTRLCWPEKYEQELQELLKEMSTQSKQSILASKHQLRHHLIHSTETAINSTAKLLVEHWTSAECQNSFLQLTLESG